MHSTTSIARLSDLLVDLGSQQPPPVRARVLVLRARLAIAVTVGRFPGKIEGSRIIKPADSVMGYVADRRVRSRTRPCRPITDFLHLAA